ncbi:MAG TPA: TIR domain-containing protein [Microvirga sp.]|nr:TIR domain-containing protein [Microvirga sp.]
MANHIFISYARDDAALVNSLVTALEQRGAECWFAPRDITPSKQWGEAIVDAITSCRVMVLVLTRRTNTSKHVPREVEIAVESNVPVIPLRIEDVEPSRTLKFYLSTSQLLEASALDREQLADALMKALYSLTPDIFSPDGPATGVLGGADSASDTEKSARWSLRSVLPARHLWMVIGIGSTITVLVVGYALSGKRESDRQAHPDAITSDSSILEPVVSSPPAPSPDSARQDSESASPAERVRPLRIGSSVGGLAMISGTLGAFAIDDSGTVYLITAVFVTAEQDYRIGAAMLQPAALDGGMWPRDRIGQVSRLLPLGPSVPITNMVALVRLDDDVALNAMIPFIGRITGVRAIDGDILGATVRKVGNATGLTTGQIVLINTDLRMASPDIESDDMITVTDALMATNMSGPGDAGALVVDDRNRAVGIIVAGSLTHTVIAPLDAVLRQFEVHLLTDNRTGGG